MEVTFNCVWLSIPLTESCVISVFIGYQIYVVILHGGVKSDMKIPEKIQTYHILTPLAQFFPGPGFAHKKKKKKKKKKKNKNFLMSVMGLTV